MQKSRMQAEGLINLFVGITEIILALRIIFRLFDANSTVSFVHWIYSTSAVLLTPFRGIFSSITLAEPRYVLDMTALLAMALYAAAGYILIGLMGWSVGRKK